MPKLYKNGRSYRFRWHNPLTNRSEWSYVRPHEYDGTEKDAKRVMNSFLGMRAEHRPVNSNEKFLPYARDVIAGLRLGNKTRQTYITNLENHMASLHHLKVSEIKVKHIRAVISEMENKPKPENVRNANEPYSGNSIRNVRIPLNKILRQALIDEILLVNPVGLADWPECDTDEPRLLDGEGVRALLQAAIEFHRYKRSKYAAIVALALFAGLRKGEIIRLVWDDIDFESRVIYIRKEGIRRVKTKNAVRPIEMSQILHDILWQHRLEITRSNELDLVFITRDGNPMGDRNLGTIIDSIIIRSGVWDPKSKKPELAKKPTLHPLRHNYFSVLVAEGVDIVYTAHQGGHANAGFTLNRYAHVMRKLTGVAAAAQDAHWGGTGFGQVPVLSGEHGGNGDDSST